MISVRWFMILCIAGSTCYKILLDYLLNQQRKLPLPAEVADIYTAERYQQFLKYEADYDKVLTKSLLIQLMFDAALILSPAFQWFEHWFGSDPVFLAICTYLIVNLEYTIADIIEDYIITFRIEEKYGMNKMTVREFWKDEILERIPGVLLVLSVLIFVSYVSNRFNSWTSGYTIGSIQLWLIIDGIVTGFVAIVILVQLSTVILMHKQYRFTPMEDGTLKDKIMEMQRDSRKKVKRIYIYNESAKSTSKNAFLLRFFQYREFGIADNFINENSERELLAVLAHEIGHLKYRRKFIDYVNIAVNLMLLILLLFLVVNWQYLVMFSAWVRQSFGLSVTNYYLLMTIVSMFMSPIIFLRGVWANWCSRYHEYDADRNAVKHGYGDELIASFKRLSSDELIDVNPHPVVEFLTDSHPGMYQRIRAIRKEQEKKEFMQGE